MFKMTKIPFNSAGGVKAAAAGVIRRPAFQAIALVALVSAGVLMIAISSPRAAGTFDPTITFETSTTRATAHPDLRITVDNSASDEDIEDLTIDMPNSFWGSLDAVSFKCDYDDAQNAACPPETAVGTIDAEATIDQSDTKLNGTIYLTEAAPGNDDPAGLSIEVPAQVGGVDLGSVVVNARVMARYDDAAPSVPIGVTGPIRGIRTVIDDIPDSHTDNSPNASGRTVSFKMTRMVANLRSDQAAPRSPLLTNPSKCGTTQFSWTAIGDDSGAKSDSSDYVVDQCNTAKIGLSQFSFSPSTTSTDDGFILTTDIGFDPDGSGVAIAQVTFPPYASANTAAFGDASVDQCPVESFGGTAAGGFAFSKDLPGFECPAQAKIGTAEAVSPMLPDPLKGEVYLLEKAPIPNIGVVFDPSVDPANPKGVTVSLVGTTGTIQYIPSCDPLFETCDQALRATFQGIPDAPVTGISMVLGTTDARQDSLGNPLQGTPLKMAAAADSVCVGSGDVSGTFVSHASPSLRAFGASPLPITGCSGATVEFDSGPVGTVTSDPTPVFTFTSGGVSPMCGFDYTLDVCPTPPDEFTPASNLAEGLHFVEVLDGSSRLTRAFVVRQASPAPTPPQTTIDSGPADASTTSDTTPTWTFSADESSKFQCSVDDGAFVPCGPASSGTTGDFTVPAADEFLPGTDHKFQVRAQDDAGNVDPSPATVDFDVSVPFEPTFTVDVSTTQARAHPDVDITITNPSEQDIEDATIKMPDGFFGGLQGVESICPVAVADAGNCPDGSQVGTIDTEGVVDESIVRIGGKVFLTEARQPGDAAGLMIEVPAQIQSINMGDILVPARLTVRGEAEGIDSLVIGAPRSIDPPDSINPWDAETEFTLRKLELKMRTNSAASQPLLTNPSSCATSEFKADFLTYAPGSDTASSSQSFTPTGCDALGFAPNLAVIVRKPDGALPDGDDFQKINLSATLNAEPGEAGIAAASILMPKPITVDPLKLPPVICEVAQYPSDCPAISRVGTAEANSPLLLPGEKLSGPVYLLRNPGKVLPRLFVKLEGRINVNVLGVNRFENVNQLRTEFADLPDAPLSSFTMTVSDFMLTQERPCELAEQFGSDMTGSLTAHNGKTAPVSSHLPFECSSLRDGIGVKKVFRKRGKNSTLSLGLRAKGRQPNMRDVTLSLGKGLKFNRKQLMRRLSIRVNGKRMSRAGVKRSIKIVNSRTIKFRFGSKRYRRIDFAFRKGSLTATRNLRRPSARVTVTPGLKKRRDSKLINLAGASIQRYRVAR